MAKSRTGSSKIMWREPREVHARGSLLDVEPVGEEVTAFHLLAATSGTSIREGHGWRTRMMKAPAAMLATTTITATA
jgi:hypothetical protein